jgi:hypothetical protein
MSVVNVQQVSAQIGCYQIHNASNTKDLIIHIITNQTIHYNVTFRRVRVTTLATEK